MWQFLIVLLFKLVATVHAALWHWIQYFDNYVSSRNGSVWDHNSNIFDWIVDPERVEKRFLTSFGKTSRVLGSVLHQRIVQCFYLMLALKSLEGSLVRRPIWDLRTSDEIGLLRTKYPTGLRNGPSPDWRRAYSFNSGLGLNHWLGC